MKRHLFLFMFLNILPAIVLAQDYGYRNTEQYICQKYPDGGVAASRMEYCRDMCSNLYFPPSEEDTKRQGSSRICYDMTNNRAYGSCPPVGRYVEPGTKVFSELNRINQDFKRCPNNEEYILLKEAYALERPPIDERATQAYREQLIEQAIIRGKERRSKISQTCKGLPKIDLNSIELISKKFSSHPNSIKLERVSLDGDSNCVATFYYPKGVISCGIKDVDSTNQLLLDDKNCK